MKKSKSKKHATIHVSATLESSERGAEDEMSESYLSTSTTSKKDHFLTTSRGEADSKSDKSVRKSGKKSERSRRKSDDGERSVRKSVRKGDSSEKLKGDSSERLKGDLKRNNTSTGYDKSSEERKNKESHRKSKSYHHSKSSQSIDEEEPKSSRESSHRRSTKPKHSTSSSSLDRNATNPPIIEEPQSTENVSGSLSTEVKKKRSSRKIDPSAFDESNFDISVPDNKPIGVVIVQVCSARHLKTDRAETINTICEIGIEGEIKSTKLKKNKSNPKWNNEIFVFYLRSKISKLVCYLWNSVDKDTVHFLGRFYYDLKNLTGSDRGSEEKEFQLHPKTLDSDPAYGNLTLKLSWIEALDKSAKELYDEEVEAVEKIKNRRSSRELSESLPIIDVSTPMNLESSPEVDIEVARANEEKLEKLDAERKEAERIEEMKRIEAERIERQRIEEEKQEAERLEKEKKEAEKLEKQRRKESKRAKKEAERLENERREAERLESERREAERLENERREAERLDNERREAERLENERKEAERFENERREAERLENERREAERLENERRETERLAEERKEAERIENEKRQLEEERREAERLEKERKESERLKEETEEAERKESIRIIAENLARREEDEQSKRDLERKALEETREAEIRALGYRTGSEDLLDLEANRLEEQRVESEKREAEKREAEKHEAEKRKTEKIETQPREVIMLKSSISTPLRTTEKGPELNSNLFSLESVVDREDMQPDYIYKVIIIGDSGVGKTQFYNRWFTGDAEGETKITINVSICLKTFKVDDSIVNIQLLDTAGQERYRAITRQYYRGAQGVLFMYDITDRLSFEHLLKWFEDVESAIDKNVVSLLVGNKADLAKQRSVTVKEALELAKTRGMSFLEASALDGDNCMKAMQLILQEIHQINKNQGGKLVSKGNGLASSPRTIVLDQKEQEEKKKDGCQC